jgi:hypothetical protein
MPDQNNLPYLVKRERQSRELAAESGDVSVRLAHLNMANGYAARIYAMRPKIVGETSV